MREMDLEKTLTAQIKLRTSALAVIDVQNDFCHGEGFFSKKNGEMGHVQRMIGNLVSILEKWRQAKMPVIFVRTIHSEWTDSAAWLTALRAPAPGTFSATLRRWCCGRS